MKQEYIDSQRVTTALLLAAGTGSRLYPLTENTPKCLTTVDGVSIIERLTFSLIKHGFKRLVVVTGYMENCIRDFLGNQVGEMKIDYIFSPLYHQTNNIYSLWMVREMINEPFLLLESDLVFDESLLPGMLFPDRIVKRLDKHISDGRVNEYYETVFAEMIDDGSLSFEIVTFDNRLWCEIDTIEYLAKAEDLFLSSHYATMETVTFLQNNY
jgi:choline kinase